MAHACASVCVCVRATVSVFNFVCVQIAHVSSHAPLSQPYSTFIGTLLSVFLILYDILSSFVLFTCSNKDKNVRKTQALIE